MTTYTPRLKLAKPNPTGEVVSVELFNQNADELDKYAGGLFICTSTTRPAEPYPGMQIYETDTTFTLTWNGSQWTGRPWLIERYRRTVFGHSGAFQGSSWDGTRRIVGTPAEWGIASLDEEKSTLTIPEAGWYAYEVNIRVDTGAAVALSVFATPEATPAVNQATQASAQSIKSSGIFYAAKGSIVESRFFSAASTTIMVDVPADPNVRSVFKLRYLGGPSSA